MDLLLDRITVMISRIGVNRALRSLTQLSMTKTGAQMSCIYSQHRCFARKRRGGREEEGLVSSRTPPPPKADPWVEVVDEETKQIYYWNTDTDETTALGEPKPTGMTAAPNGQQVVEYQQPGFMGMMAQGFALGTGSSIAHHAIGSMFGGGSDDGGGDGMSGGGGDSGGDGSWDI